MGVAEKTRIRQQMSALRRGLTPEFRADASAGICRLLSSMPEVAAAAKVAAYVSDGSEPDLSVFIVEFSRRGGTVFLPRSYRGPQGLTYELAEVNDLSGDLVSGSYGIMEPCACCRTASAEEKEEMLWLTPGVAFDLSGNRLGRGKGFYDRLILGRNGMAIGVFFGIQQIGAVPMDSHDQPLDAVVTETAVYRF